MLTSSNSPFQTLSRLTRMLTHRLMSHFLIFDHNTLNCNTIRPALDSGLERVAKPRLSLITVWTCSARRHGSQGVWSPNHLEVLLAPVVVIYPHWQWHPPPLPSLSLSLCLSPDVRLQAKQLLCVSCCPLHASTCQLFTQLHERMHAYDRR